MLNDSNMYNNNYIIIHIWKGVIIHLYLYLYQGCTYKYMSSYTYFIIHIWIGVIILC